MRAAAQDINRPFQDVRQQLRSLGVSETSATLIIPLVWTTPATSDRYAPGIILLVQALQVELARRGHANRMNGYVDDATDQALAAVCGPMWKSKPWIVVVGEILASSKETGMHGLGSLGSQGMGSLGAVRDFPWWAGRPMPRTPPRRRGTAPPPAPPRRPRKVAPRPACSGPGCIPPRAAPRPVSAPSVPIEAVGYLGLGFDIMGVLRPDTSKWTVSGNLCKPVDSAQLGVFKNLQRQTNRVLSAFKGGKTIAEDGIIGPATIDAVKRAGQAARARLAASRIAAIATVTTCTSLALIAADLAKDFGSVASAQGAPPQVSAPVPKTKAVVDPTTGQVQMQPTIAGLLPFEVTPVMLMAGAAGLAVAAALWKRRKQKRAAGASSAAGA